MSRQMCNTRVTETKHILLRKTELLTQDFSEETGLLQFGRSKQDLLFKLTVDMLLALHMNCARIFQHYTMNMAHESVVQDLKITRVRPH